MYQFKSFGIKAMQHLNKWVIKEAMHGNLRPALSLVLWSQVIGEPINNLIFLASGKGNPFTERPGLIKDAPLWPGETREDKFFMDKIAKIPGLGAAADYSIEPGDVARRMVDNLFGVGGMGYVFDMLTNVRYNIAGPASSVIMGPAVADLDDVLEKIFRYTGQFEMGDETTQEGIPFHRLLSKGVKMGWGMIPWAPAQRTSPAARAAVSFIEGKFPEQFPKTFSKRQVPKTVPLAEWAIKKGETFLSEHTLPGMKKPLIKPGVKWRQKLGRLRLDLRDLEKKKDKLKPPTYAAKRRRLLKDIKKKEAYLRIREQGGPPLTKIRKKAIDAAVNEKFRDAGSVPRARPLPIPTPGKISGVISKAKGTKRPLLGSAIGGTNILSLVDRVMGRGKKAKVETKKTYKPNVNVKGKEDSGIHISTVDIKDISKSIGKLTKETKKTFPTVREAFESVFKEQPSLSSGYRDYVPKGGSKTSKHLDGEAFDIKLRQYKDKSDKMPSASYKKAKTAAINLGKQLPDGWYVILEKHEWHIHVEKNPSKVKSSGNVVIEESSTKKGTFTTILTKKERDAAKKKK